MVILDYLPAKQKSHLEDLLISNKTHRQKFSQKSTNSTWNISPYLGKYPSGVSRTCLCCTLFFKQTTFFLPSPAVFNIKSSQELGLYSDFTSLTQIKSCAQVPLLQLLLILLELGAEPKEGKALDGAAGDLLL